MKEEISQKKENRTYILDYIITLAKHKRLIISTVFVVSIIVIIVSLVMTPIYKAETRILTSQNDTSNAKAQLLGDIGNLRNFIGDGIGIKTSDALYLELLRSNPILDGIIDKFKLMKLYDVKYRDDARDVLIDALDTNFDLFSGILTIGIEANNPKMAARLANAFVDELKNFIKKIAISKASQRRLFYEEQLKETKLALIVSEEDVKKFQEKTGAMRLESQATAIISSIESLRAQIASKEVEIKVMKAYATEQLPTLQAKQEELKGLKEELEKLEIKKGPYNPDPLMPAGRVPGVSLEYMRKIRNLKFNEASYEFIFKQYETAKIDESSNATIIQVIDKAEPPLMRIRPERRRMVTKAFFLALFFSMAAVLLLEYLKKIFQDPSNKETINALQVHVNKEKLAALKKHIIFWKNN